MVVCGLALVGTVALLRVEDEFVQKGRIDYWEGVVLLAGLLTVVAGLRRRWFPLALLIVIAAWLLVPSLISVLVDVVPGGSPVVGAVGSGAYYGYGFQSYQRAGIATFLIFIAGAILVIRHRGIVKFGHRSEAENTQLPAAALEHGHQGPGIESSFWHQLVNDLPGLVAILSVAVVLLPNIYTQAISFDVAATFRQVDPASFDLGNALYWASAFSEDQVGMRDVLFPYGETWVFLRFPWGSLVDWATRVLTLVVFYVALRRGELALRWRSAAVVLTLGLMMMWWPAVPRYSTSIAIGIALGAYLQRDVKKIGVSLLAFILALFLALFWGVDQFLYGIGGGALVVLGNFVRETGGFRRKPSLISVGRLFARFGIPVAIVVCAFCLWWVQVGAFQERTLYLLHLQEVSAFASSPLSWAVMSGQGGVFPSLSNVSLAAATVLAVLGLFVMVGGRRLHMQFACILLAGGGVLGLVFMKHLIRNQGDIPVHLALLVVIVYLIVTIRSVTDFHTLIRLLVVLPVIVIGIHATTATERSRAAFASAKTTVTDDLAVLTGDALVPRASDVFSPSNLPDWQPETTVLRALQTELARTRTPPSRVAVVGNAPLLYLKLGLPVPFGLNLYDASPKYLQERMLAELQQRDPVYVVFENERFVDGIPYAARVPLLVRWVTAHYVPVRNPTTSWVIAERIASATPESYAAWSLVLGHEVDLGAIPSFSNGGAGSRCLPGSAHCSEWLRIRGLSGNGQAAKLSTVSVTAPQPPSWAVVLRSRANVRDYWVRVDRLWFAPVLQYDAEWVCAKACNVEQVFVSEKGELW